MAQQIIDTGANANDGTGEPLRNAFTAVNENFTEIYTAGPVGSNIRIIKNEIVTTDNNQNIILKPAGIGVIQANSSVVPGTAGIYNIGEITNPFQYIHGSYFVGNGALLTGIVANTSYNNSNVAAFLPTYTGNLVSLTGPVSTTGNIIAGNFRTSGTVSATGTITGGSIIGNNISSLGYVSAVGNIITNSQISAVGNITGNYLLGNGSQLTGITVASTPAGALTGTTLSANVLYSSLKVVDDLLYLDVVGNVTTSGRFIGSGAGLTNIPASNISGQVANALVAGTVYTNAQPNITSVGTLSSLTATGNIAGNYFIGNGSLLTGISASGAYANALVGDVLSANVLYSSLKVVDDLLYLDVVGNVTTSGRFIGSGAGLTNVPGANISGAVANATYATTAGTAYLVSGANVSGAVANATYAATAGSATTAVTANKATYADTANAVSGANVSGTVANATYATTAGSATTAGTVTTPAQPNITSVGTLTSVTVSGNITGGNISTGGKISAVGNITGNYFIGNGALLTGISASNVSVDANALVGTTLSANVLYSSLKVVDDLLYLDVVGNVTTTGQFIGSGAGLTNISGANISGQVANALVAGTVYTNAQPNITSVGTLSSLTATGNITGNYFIGNGSLLTGISKSGAYANALVGDVLSANVLYSSLKVVDDLLYLDVVGNVTTTGQFIGSGAGLTNISGANITGSISTSGNITGNYFSGNGSQLTGIVATQIGVLSSLSVTGNTRTGNLLTGGTVSAVGNVAGTYFIGNGSQLTGITVSAGTAITNGNSNVTVNANGNITVGVAGTSNVAVFASTGAYVTGQVSATGNITGNYILGNGALLTGVITSVANINNGTSNVTVVSSNGNVSVGVGGSGNVAVFSTTGEYVTGLISATGNITGNFLIGNGSQLTGITASNVGVLSVLSVTGNITTGNLLTNGLVSATGNVTGNYLLGNGAFITGLPAGYSNANVANYLPTYTGNLASLAGPVITTSNVTGNYILGNGAFLTGVITSVANINNGTSNVSIATSGGNVTVSVGGTPNVAVFATTGEYVTGVLSASGNVTGGNVLTSGLISVGSNVYAGNLIVSSGPFSGNITAQGIISAYGNILTGSAISATGNITGSNITTSGQVSATSNVTGGNLLTGGQISAGGNITGPMFNGNVNFASGTVSGNGNITGGNITACSAISTATFSSTGNATSGNVLTGGQVSAGGNITSGSYVIAQNLIVGPGITGGVISALGNITGGNLITSGIISGNVVGNITGTTVSVIGNITGGNIGTLGTISANGNITGSNLSISSNITGGNLSNSGNITGANVNTNNIVGTAITITSTGALNLVPTGNITANSKKITGLADPVQDQDAATKANVDSIAQGLDPKATD